MRKESSTRLRPHLQPKAKRLIKSLFHCHLVVVRDFGSVNGSLRSFNLFWRCCAISVMEHQINEEIRDEQVRVIDSDGTQLGIISSKEALDIAVSKELDLVKIAPTANPPVCKIMDYGKYCFEQTKREKEARKNQKTVEVKEVRMTSKIDTNDFNTKANQAIKFLKGGDKVKVSIRLQFRKGVALHSEMSEKLLEQFKEMIAEYGVFDKPSKVEGRNIVLFVSPKTSK